MKKIALCLTCLALLLGIASFLPTETSSKNVGATTKVAKTTPAPAELPQSRESGKYYTPDGLVERAAREAAFSELIVKAHAEGPVRVIVGVRMSDFKPEGKLADGERIAQRNEIAQAQSRLLENLSATTIKVKYSFKFIPFIAMTADAAALEAMNAMSEVVSLQEDSVNEPHLAQSVPLIGAPTAWTAGFTGQNQAVAILDTGVDKTHSFLTGKVVSEACYSTTQINSSSVCPGGASSSTASGSGVNCSTSVSGCNHGTHVAGIAAGTNATFSGVAKGSNVIAVQVFSRFDSTTDCKSTPAPCVLSFDSDMLRGLERVFAIRGSFNIASVNMSIGGGRFFSTCDAQKAALKTAIDNLRSADIATVISSGNDSFKDSIGAPACISSAISVGSTGDGSGATPVNTVSGFSNSASFLSLLAPGNLINSSVPGNAFSNFQGTSMAAPHVAGAWAVMKSKKPTGTVTEIFTALRDTGLSVTDTNGITKPRIKLDAAINAIGGGGGGGGCATTPIALGQTLNGSLTTSSCRYPTGSQFYSNAYSFNGTAGQQVAILMTSGAFDTFLRLVGPAGTEVASDDDGGGDTNSRIPATSGFFTLPSTGTYIIQASSFSPDATGAYSLTLSGPSSGVGNNNFANGQTISGNSGSTTGSNAGANKEAGEPNHGGIPGGASVWYFWTAPSSGLATFTTAGSNFDTLLGVYTGGSVGGLATIGGNDDASPSDLSSIVSFSAVAGTTYRIAVDGYAAATGSIVLNWNVGSSGPANNNFANAQTIAGSSGSVNGNNNNATTEAGEPDHAGNNGGVSVWYSWVAPSSGTATVTTQNSNFDTLLAVYTGGSVAGLSTIASNDDENLNGGILSSKVTFNAVSGTTYKIAVDGYGGAVGNITLNWSAGAASTVLGSYVLPDEYDGDGKTDIAIFRPSTGVWYVLKSSTNYTGSFLSFGWGQNGDIPVPADYDGDNICDVAIFRPSNGVWYILRSSTGYNPAAFQSFGWGQNGDIPVPGDFDGDNRADLVIFRPSNGVWYILKSSTNYNPALYQGIGWGVNGDVPVPADYDGDFRADPAIFRPSNGVWYILKSTTNYNPAQFLGIGWGQNGDLPVPADYDGDAKADLAIMRPSNGVWYILKSSTSYNPGLYQGVGWGVNGDVPVPAEYDGDNKRDIAIFRPATGVWYALKSTTNYNPAAFLGVGWGNPGDIPASTQLVR